MFCTKTDFTNTFAKSLDFAEIKNIENMSVGMTYRTTDVYYLDRKLLKIC